MSAFLNEIHTKIVPPCKVGRSSQTYVLDDDFEYESGVLGRIVVPTGFCTDFASIPRPAFAYIDPEDRVILYPSVIHDYLYSMMGKLPDGRTYTREQADQVLREAMELAGARIDQRFIVYHAVRLFGGSHWNSL